MTVNGTCAVKNVRQSRFELLRIISMLMIVAHHFVAKNAFNADTDIIGLSVNKLFLQFIGNHAFIGNNLFFMISAWFLCDLHKEYNVRKSVKSIWKIERQMLFYSISICIVLILIGGGYINLPIIAKSVFPMSTGIWWYHTTYAVFLLISPYLFKGISALSKKEIEGLIIVMLLLWSVSTLVPFFSYGADNFLCFVMLYVIVFYIRNHAVEIAGHKKVYISMIAIGYAAAFASIIFMDLLGTKISLAAEYSCYFIRGNYRILPMIISVGIFLWSLNLKFESKVINYAASLMFGVYLIHMYPPIERLLFTEIFDIGNIIGSAYLPLAVSAEILLIFIVCSVIEALRKVLFKYTFDILERHISNKIDAVCRVKKT